MKKSFLQKVYSFFGFSSYIQCIDDDKAYKVVYWCCFPWGKFFRKFDLFTIDVSSIKSISAQNQESKRSKTT